MLRCLVLGLGAGSPATLLCVQYFLVYQSSWATNYWLTWPVLEQTKLCLKTCNVHCFSRALWKATLLDLPLCWKLWILKIHLWSQFNNFDSDINMLATSLTTVCKVDQTKSRSVQPDNLTTWRPDVDNDNMTTCMSGSAPQCWVDGAESQRSFDWKYWSVFFCKDSYLQKKSQNIIHYLLAHSFLWSFQRAWVWYTINR